MKIRAIEAKAFLADSWDTLVPKGTQGKDWYLDGGVDDPDSLPDADWVHVEDLGDVDYQGPDPEWRGDCRKYPTILGLFKKWRKARTHDWMLVEYPREKEAELRAFLASIKARRVKS